ncbi:tyrosine phosphatase domain-containing protein [Rhizobium phage RHph_Y1_11]|nr:tyrosine phosphatase domain-containing protein [Rhizobium phage RHph_Y1_11]
MGRKSLNDVLSNDRSVARQAQGGPAYVKTEDDWAGVPPTNGGVIHMPSNTSHKGGYDFGEKCYKTHPHLKLGTGVLVGASCYNPIVNDASAYIGFDGVPTIPAYDFTTQPARHSITHKIQDMHAPDKPEEFVKLVGWTVNQLKDGKTIHCGCIGGHGRTGTFIAAVVKEILGEEDAIEWTRSHYCKRAVESKEQAVFLNKHFGIAIQKGYKEKASSGGKSSEGGTRHGPQSKAFVPIGPKYDIFKA